MSWMYDDEWNFGEFFDFSFNKKQKTTIHKLCACITRAKIGGKITSST